MSHAKGMRESRNETETYGTLDLPILSHTRNTDVIDGFHGFHGLVVVMVFVVVMVPCFWWL